MEPWLQTLVTVLGAIAASSGFWLFLEKRATRKDANSELLLGLAHERIMSLGTYYLDRRDENGEAWITPDEYENLYEYLYKPYEARGGNGSAKRLMNEVNKLPIHNNHGARSWSSVAQENP